MEKDCPAFTINATTLPADVREAVDRLGLKQFNLADLQVVTWHLEKMLREFDGKR